MAHFKYTARNNAGKTIEGTIDAPVQKLAIERLRNQHFTVMALSEVKDARGGGSFFSRIKDFISQF